MNNLVDSIKKWMEAAFVLDKFITDSKRSLP